MQSEDLCHGALSYKLAEAEAQRLEASATVPYKLPIAASTTRHSTAVRDKPLSNDLTSVHFCCSLFNVAVDCSCSFHTSNRYFLIQSPWPYAITLTSCNHDDIASAMFIGRAT